MPNTNADLITNHESAAYRRDALPRLLAMLRLRNSVLDLSMGTLRQVRITRIECFRFDSGLAEKLHPGSGSDYCCGLLKIYANTGAAGTAQFAIPRASLNGDLVMWANPFHRLKGLTLLEGFHYAQHKQEAWGPARFELLLTALMNVQANREPAAAGQENEQPQYVRDRAYLLRHTQTYVVF
ncbi:hypothetical protein GXP70_09835 [Paenibacillus lycopersici]|uniref:Uncharacterized protein n=1 Tax=Paenibacillus lycopersici TaxID=2704462 RepID=A0A6C0FVZ2_9BACL|nr:hypothetical protein [Paenibacillus lycopersici]QHT60212.1 hypothetical protein GXP70_09835 [Paenibacillus lycopersici]